jgi:hypothetical protein
MKKKSGGIGRRTPDYRRLLPPKIRSRNRNRLMKSRYRLNAP